MAGFLRNVSRFCSPAIKASSRLLLQNSRCLKPELVVVPTKNMFTESYVGMDLFLENKKRIGDQFGHMREKFFERMKQYMGADSKQNMVFTEDLKNVTYLASDTPEDLEMLVTMIKKFNSQNKELRFGSFIFGPVVLRRLHEYGKWEAALALLKDEECKGFFDQISSYLIIMDMMYKKGQFDRIIELWRHYCDVGHFEQKYPRDLILLVLAASYKINTPEVFKLSSEVVKKARESGSPITKRGVALYAALALKQNSPELALESLSMTFPRTKPLLLQQSAPRRQRTSMTPPSVANMNLRTIALSKMTRDEDAILALRGVLNDDSPKNSEVKILPETLAVVKSGVQTTGSKELLHEIGQIERSLQDHDKMLNQTIEGLLNEPIEGFNNRGDLQFDPDRNAGRRSGFNRQLHEPLQRRGLMDAED